MAVGAVGLVGGQTTLTVRAGHLTQPDAAAFLAGSPTPCPRTGSPIPADAGHHDPLALVGATQAAGRTQASQSGTGEVVPG